MGLISSKNRLVNEKTGEMICDFTPKFVGLKREDYKALFDKDRSIRFLEPMTAEERNEEDTEAMMGDPNTIAEKKWDGHRALSYLTRDGNRLFSRNISKKSGWYSENSDQVPHIRDISVRVELCGSVIDGELTLPIPNCTHRDVQSVTGSLPETAIANQLERGFAVLNAFDILYYKGRNIQKFPYWKRKVYLLRVIQELSSEYVKFCGIYCTDQSMRVLTDKWKGYATAQELKHLVGYCEVVSSYSKLFKGVIEAGDEGLILKNINAVYEQKRTKNFTKLKAHNTYDCIIMGYEEPTREFTGDTPLNQWEHWEDEEGTIYSFPTEEQMAEHDLEPVTKFYANGWIGALLFGVWKERQMQYYVDTYGKRALLKYNEDMDNGVIIPTEKHHLALTQVGRCSGLDDETRAELSRNRDRYLGAVIEVMAQGIINKSTGSLQHPRFIMFRSDKDSEMCTFGEHLRKYGEDKKK